MKNAHGLRLEEQLSSSSFPPVFFKALIELIYAQSRSLFLWVPVLFSLGIGFYFSLPKEPPLWMVFVLGLFILACLCLAHVKIKENNSSDRILTLRLLLVAMSIVAGGFLSAQMRTVHVSEPVIDRVFETSELRGVVERKEHTRRGTLRLVIRTLSIADLDVKSQPSNVVLLVYGDAPTNIEEGTTIKARARLEPSYRPAYPGAYDPAFKDYYNSIGARGRILGQLEVLGKDRSSFHSEIESLRSRVSHIISSSISTNRQADEGFAMGPFATALLTGKRDKIDASLVSALRGAGLAHILAISGLHMALFTGALFWLIRGVMSLSPRFALTHPIKKYAAVIALIGGSVYLVISGAPVSAQRAFIMAGVMFVAILVDRHAISLHNLAIAAMVILILRPESLLSISFQMSFASVAALIAFYEAYRRRHIPLFIKLGRWRSVAMFFISIGLTTIIATLATAPFVSHYFGNIPTYGLLANLLVMPIFTILTMPLALLGFILMPLGLGGLMFALMGHSLWLISEIAVFVSGLEGAVYVVPQISAVSLLLFITAGLWLLLWKARLRALSIVPFIFGLVTALTEPKSDILISERGHLLGVKDGRHRLALSTRGSSYVAKRWLQYYGDGRDVKLARRSERVKCDGQGCAGVLELENGQRHQIALVFERSILAEECHRADVLIIAAPIRVMPRECSNPQIVISRLDLWRDGAHALRVSENGNWHVKTASSQQGERPWNRDWQYRQKKR